MPAGPRDANPKVGVGWGYQTWGLLGVQLAGVGAEPGLRSLCDAFSQTARRRRDHVNKAPLWPPTARIWVSQPPTWFGPGPNKGTRRQRRTR